MRRKNISNNNSGFTLIELLVVIIILSILATAAFVYLNPTQWTARGNDTKRLADMKNLYDAISRESAQGNITLVNTPADYSTIQARANESGVENGASIGFIKFTLNNPADLTYKLGGFPVFPVDPKNNTQVTYKYLDSNNALQTITVTARYKYCVSADGFELNTLLEADSAKMANEGGNDPMVYEVGTDLKACRNAFNSSN